MTKFIILIILTTYLFAENHLDYILNNIHQKELKINKILTDSILKLNHNKLELLNQVIPKTCEVEKEEIILKSFEKLELNASDKKQFVNTKDLICINNIFLNFQIFDIINENLSEEDWNNLHSLTEENRNLLRNLK